MRAVGYACPRSAESPPEVPADVRDKLGIALPGAGLAAERAAIEAVCAQREWELADVFVDDPDRDGSNRRAGYARALQELADGRADVLVVAKLDALGAWAELPDFLDRSEREGWDLVALDFLLDTLTAEGKNALRAIGAKARSAPRSELPMPPGELMFRVVGSDSAGRFEVGGRLQLEDLNRVLAAHDRELADFGDILDFGCGPGRFIRQLRAMAPEARLCGVDQDEEAIAWVRRELPFAETAVAPPLPPLPLAANRFDLIIVYSVFTHLDEAYQDAWLAELLRLTRPGAYVLATVHGMTKWEEIRHGPMAGEDDLEQSTAEFGRRGFMHWRGDDWGAFFPDYYHTSFHRSDYIRERWTRWFDVVDVVEPQVDAPGQSILNPGHDIVLLRARRRARLAGSGLARRVRDRLVSGRR